MTASEYLLKKYKLKIRSTKGRTDKLGNPIEFKLTFDEWVNIWVEAGKLPNRDYVLSRTNDIGHYEIGNVYVNHALHNVTEALTENTELDQKITQYAIETGYKRRIVKAMIKRGELSL
jgi:hypothetical protein